MPSSADLPIQLILRRRLQSSGPPSALDLFESELVSRLKGDADLSSLINGRIYPLLVPEKPRLKPDGKKSVHLPCVVYAITANDRVRNLQGPAGVATASVAVDIRSDRYGTVKAIRESLRRYDGFRGVLAEDVIILQTWFRDQNDDFQFPAGGGTDAGTYTEALGLKFKYREPRIPL